MDIILYHILPNSTPLKISIRKYEYHSKQKMNILLTRINAFLFLATEILHFYF